MKILISGHRIQKLQCYNLNWIRTAIEDCFLEYLDTGQYIRGYAGMASGVDLWFCDICFVLKIPYVACVPFEGQEDTMSKEDSERRKFLIHHAENVMSVKNSFMVEEADEAIVVWDGNKGGTHNVFQQLIEKKKSFKWINPVSEKIWYCK